MTQKPRTTLEGLQSTLASPWEGGGPKDTTTLMKIKPSTKGPVSSEELYEVDIELSADYI